MKTLTQKQVEKTESTYRILVTTSHGSVAHTGPDIRGFKTAVRELNRMRDYAKRGPECVREDRYYLVEMTAKLLEV